MIKKLARNNKILLLSIKPKYSKKLLDKEKTIELRKTKPKVNAGDYILIYESSPTMSLMGYGTIDKIIAHKLPQLWNLVKHNAGVTHKEFFDYFGKSSIGYGILLSEVHKLDEPIGLNMLRKKWNNFHPPQIFRYITHDQIKIFA